MPCSLTPVGLPAPGQYGAGVLSPLTQYQDDPHDTFLSRLYRTAFGLAVYASQAPLRDWPTQDSLPAGGQPLPGRILLPGSLREVSALSTVVYIASPFPGLAWRTSGGTSSGRTSFRNVAEWTTDLEKYEETPVGDHMGQPPFR
jgi:hypothetical protein